MWKRENILRIYIKAAYLVLPRSAAPLIQSLAGYKLNSRAHLNSNLVLGVLFGKNSLVQLSYSCASDQVLRSESFPHITSTPSRPRLWNIHHLAQMAATWEIGRATMMKSSTTLIVHRPAMSRREISRLLARLSCRETFKEDTCR